MIKAIVFYIPFLAITRLGPAGTSAANQGR